MIERGSKRANPDGDKVASNGSRVEVLHICGALSCRGSAGANDVHRNRASGTGRSCVSGCCIIDNRVKRCGVGCGEFVGGVAGGKSIGAVGARFNAACTNVPLEPSSSVDRHDG
jgi:hypothetical protein